MPGEAWVFDDTIEHEARNDSDKLRVVLIFDVWHPHLTPAERALITALNAGMNAFAGGSIPVGRVAQISGARARPVPTRPAHCRPGRSMAAARPRHLYAAAKKNGEPEGPPVSRIALECSGRPDQYLPVMLRNRLRPSES